MGKTNKDMIPIKNKYGGTFWVEKEEYEKTYAGTYSVETEEEDDYVRERQIAYNRFEGLFKNIDKDFNYSTHGGTVDTEDILKRISSLKKEINEYLQKRGIKVVKNKDDSKEIKDFYINKLTGDISKLEKLVKKAR